MPTAFPPLSPTGRNPFLHGHHLNSCGLEGWFWCLISRQVEALLPLAGLAEVFRSSCAGKRGGNDCDWCATRNMHNSHMKIEKLSRESQWIQQIWKQKPTLEQNQNSPKYASTHLNSHPKMMHKYSPNTACLSVFLTRLSFLISLVLSLVSQAHESTAKITPTYFSNSAQHWWLKCLSNLCQGILALRLVGNVMLSGVRSLNLW